MARTIPGLNAVHVWDGSARLNDNIDGPPFIPRVSLKRIPGWNTRPEMTDTRDKSVGRNMREITRKAQLDGKPLVYEGLVEAMNQVDLENYMGSLAQSFAPTDERIMYVYPFDKSGPFYFKARITAYDPAEELTEGIRSPSGGYARTFLLGLRMSDARKYTLSAVDSRYLDPSQASPVLATGTPLPQTLPFTLGPVVPPYTALNVPFPATNDQLWIWVDGSAETDPLIWPKQYPGNSIDIYNFSATGPGGGQARRFRCVLPGIYNQITVDFYNRVVMGDGFDLTGYIDDVNSDWWDAGVPGLVPGWNLIQGALAVRHRPALF